MLSVHHSADFDPASVPEAEMQAGYAAVGALNERMMSEGAWVFAGGLCPPDTSTVVRVNDGEIVLTDGPFAETREQLGGFWVIEAANLDAALAWARLATVACANPVEVRPFQGEPEA
jgi:hypothetical protein